MASAHFFPLPLHIAAVAEISDGAKVVYGALAFHARTSGTCWPSHELLAREVGRSLKTVRRKLEELRREGYVSWTRRGRTLTNLYALSERTNVTIHQPERTPVTTQCLDKADHSEGPTVSRVNGQNGAGERIPLADKEIKNKAVKRAAEETETAAPAVASLDDLKTRTPGRRWDRWAYAMRAADRFPMMTVNVERKPWTGSSQWGAPERDGRTVEHCDHR